MVKFFNLIKTGKLIGISKKYNFNEHNMIKNSQNIITNKDNNIFYEKDIDIYLKKNNFIQDKKLISISPGGTKGFYLMGVLNYIKQNYDLSDYIYYLFQ